MSEQNCCFFQLSSTQLWMCRELSHESSGEGSSDSNSSGKELFGAKVFFIYFLFITNKVQKSDFLKVKNN